MLAREREFFYTGNIKEMLKMSKKCNINWEIYEKSIGTKIGTY